MCLFPSYMRNDQAIHPSETLKMFFLSQMKHMRMLTKMTTMTRTPKEPLVERMTKGKRPVMIQMRKKMIVMIQRMMTTRRQRKMKKRPLMKMSSNHRQPHRKMTLIIMLKR